MPTGFVFDFAYSLSYLPGPMKLSRALRICHGIVIAFFDDNRGFLHEAHVEAYTVTLMYS